MRKDTANWIALADYDIETALHMFATERYLYVIFLCKTHDLIYLVKKCNLELPEKHLDFVGNINTASIPTRYPDDLQRSLKEYPKSVAKHYLNQTVELIEWLKHHPNLSEL